jgi:hypothetical protein
MSRSAEFLLGAAPTPDCAEQEYAICLASPSTRPVFVGNFVGSFVGERLADKVSDKVSDKGNVCEGGFKPIGTTALRPA